MARTTYVKATRKDQGSCFSTQCKHPGEPIKKGDSYKWFSIRAYRGGRGMRKQYHADCTVPRSHTTTSNQLGTIYDAQDAADDALNALDQMEAVVEDFQQIAEECAAGIREAGEMYSEGSDNIESGFGHSTYVSDELREKADACESWADNLESLDFEDFDSDEVRAELETDAKDDPDLDVDEELESRRMAWFEDQAQRLQDAINDQPF